MIPPPSSKVRTLLLALLGLAAVAVAASAFAAPPSGAPAKLAGPPALPKPGEEVHKLAQLFGADATWAGVLKAGAMGPGSPELPTQGKHLCHALADGFWYSCDLDVAAGGGKAPMVWKGHMVVGWDGNSSAYRALLVDNLGMMVPMTGALSGTTFVLTSVQPLALMGHMTRARFTYDFADPKAIKFTNEHQVADGPWQVWELESLTASAK